MVPKGHPRYRAGVLPARRTRGSRVSRETSVAFDETRLARCATNPWRLRPSGRPRGLWRGQRERHRARGHRPRRLRRARDVAATPRRGRPIPVTSGALRHGARSSPGPRSVVPCVLSRRARAVPQEHPGAGRPSRSKARRPRSCGAPPPAFRALGPANRHGPRPEVPGRGRPKFFLPATRLGAGTRARSLRAALRRDHGSTASPVARRFGRATAQATDGRPDPAGVSRETPRRRAYGQVCVAHPTATALP